MPSKRLLALDTPQERPSRQVPAFLPALTLQLRAQMVNIA
jgi:hypothetical protein